MHADCDQCASLRVEVAMSRKLQAMLVATGVLVGCEKTEPAPETAAAPSAAAPAAPAPTVEKPPESVAAQHVLIAYRGAKNAPPGVKRTKAAAKTLADEVAAKA